MTRNALVALLAAVTALLSVAPAALATFPGANGPLMYSSNRAGLTNIDLFCLETDQFGGGPAPSGMTFAETPMTAMNSSADDHAPNWSPDGRRIAFTSSRTGDREIYVFDVVTKATTRLTFTRGVEEDYPYWNRMGTRLSFSRVGTKGKRDVWLMNADGSGQVNITNSRDADDKYAVWSPVAAEMALISDRDGDQEIYLIDAAGRILRQITRNTISDIGPDFSPDGTRMLISREQGVARETAYGPSALWIMNADGSGQRVLADRGVVDKQAEFSPDGQRVAWISSDSSTTYGPDWEVYEMRLDGTNLKRLTFNRNAEFEPTYRPVPVP